MTDLGLSWGVREQVGGPLTLAVLEDWNGCPRLEGYPGSFGYVLATHFSDTFGFGKAVSRSRFEMERVTDSVVGVALSAGGRGAWLVSQDGVVLAVGDTPRCRPVSRIEPGTSVAGIKAAPGGMGYWLFGQDGSIGAYGHAVDHGSLRESSPGIHLDQPIVSMAVTPGGGGYWLAAADGGVFCFGDAEYFGSAVTVGLGSRIVSIASTFYGRGYWMASEDGRVLCFGDAEYLGSPAELGVGGNETVIGMCASSTTLGYWTATSSGTVRAFGNVHFLGTKPIGIVIPRVCAFDVGCWN